MEKETEMKEERLGKRGLEEGVPETEPVPEA